MNIKIIMSSLLLSLALNSHAKDLSAEEIAEKSFLATKVIDSTADSTFRLINANGQERIRETKGETKLINGTTDNMRIVTFLSPSDVKGTKTLMLEHHEKDDDIWIYLPALKKVRRLVSNNKKESFVGTDFSYGDVIGHRPKEWNHKLLKSDTVDGKACYLIESTPKTNETKENSGYSKRVGCIDKESFVAISGEGYDVNGQLSRKFQVKDIRKVDEKNNKWQPMTLIAENTQTGHKTIIEFKNYKANVGVKEEDFTTRNIEKQ
jgi:outer membrane lipoprotein-sorting protein